MKHVLYGKCVKCGKTYDAVPDLTNCECGGILDIVYDYDYIRTRLTKEKLAARQDHTMWRYREPPPVEEDTPNTPCGWAESPCTRSPPGGAAGPEAPVGKGRRPEPHRQSEGPGQRHGGGQGPGGGGEGDRLLLHRQCRQLSRGQRRAGRPQDLHLRPSRAPKGKVAQLMTFGATVISVQGSYEETFELSKQAIDRWGWYNRNAAINPYLSEGKKTVALRSWSNSPGRCRTISPSASATVAPSPASGRGLKDLYAIGFIDRLPRLISAQAEGCCPSTGPLRRTSPGSPWRRTPWRTPSPWACPGMRTRP